MSRDASRINEDTLSFALVGNTSVTNDTVKLTAHVSAIIDGTQITNDNLAAKVRGLLGAFVPTEWSFSNPQRSTDTGVEKATFMAFTRVPANQNTDLDGRRRQVNERGLEIINCGADTSVPADAIITAASDLRVSLTKQAIAEAATLSTAMGREYRVASIEFGAVDDPFSNASRSKTMAFATSASGGYQDSIGDAIGNTQKFSMSANITLATVKAVPQLASTGVVLND